MEIPLLSNVSGVYFFLMINNEQLICYFVTIKTNNYIIFWNIRGNYEK